MVMVQEDMECPWVDLEIMRKWVVVVIIKCKALLSNGQLLLVVHHLHMEDTAWMMG